MGALETLLANSNAAPPTPQATSGGALEKLLAGGDSAGPATPAPSKPAAKGGSSNLLVDDLVGGTADAIDLVWTGLFAAPVAMAGEALTRAQLGTNNLLGIGEPKTRRDIGRAGQATAARLNEKLGTPVRSTLKALGLLSDRPMAVEKAMQAAMSLVERDAAAIEERTGGALQKEDAMMGVNMLFGALGAKGVQYVAKSAPERARAKEALKELAKIKEEANARLAATDAEALNREAGGIPREALPGDNPAARDANLPAFDQRVNAERQAYELMQAGASKAKVEGIIKKNPAVGVALDAMMKRRAQASSFLQEAPEVPIREDGTFAPNAATSLLHRPSEIGPAEFAARDMAAGIQRGPLGEPIFSANPQARNPQRSSRDPARRPVTDSGLEGLPVKRDSLGTPLSPNQTLAVVGATGLGLAAYYAAEGDTSDVAAAAAGGALLLGKGRGIGLDAIRALPDTTTLREIRDASAYTLNTLENLPGNRAVHSKQAVSELLRRQEVTKAERDILQGVLDSVPGETITAKQLMAGVKEATGDFELKPVASEKFADYGLENIDRKLADDGDAWIPEGATPTEEAALRAEAEAAFAAQPQATTTIYQSPFELGKNNHFGDPNYFAHTRSFYENGVKHVVEMQSDLAQKAGKVLTPEERVRLEGERDRAQARIEAALDPANPDRTRPELMVAVRSYRLAQAEANTKLANAGLGERVSPMLKRWDKRLVREELAASARGRENPKYAEAQKFLAGMQRGADDFMERQGRLKPDEAAGYYEGVEKAKADIAAQGIPERFPPEPVVRFATADTVAKVEGWPEKQRALLDRLANEEQIARLGTGLDRAAALREIENLKDRLKDQPRFRPEHQGIYDHYAKETTTFLKQLGGKEVTDSAGHTWIEVPTEGTRKMPAGRRAQQFGSADPAFLAYLATVAGAATAGYLLTENDDKKVSRSIESGIGAALGGLLILKKSGNRALRENANDVLRGVEDFASNTSYQIEKISPPVERLARNYKRLQMKATHDRLQAVAPFVEGLRRLSQKLTAEFDAAVLNGDWTSVIRAVGKAGSPELVAQLRVVIDTLKETGQQLKDAGLIKGMVPNYFPRIVNDLDGLLESLGQPAREFIEKRLAEAEEKAKPFGALTELERSIVLNKALEENLRRGPGMASSFRKGRTIEQVTADMAPFYEKPSESLLMYLRAATNQIERARFFGRDAAKSPETGKINVEASIGNKLLAEKNAGRITPAEFKELERLLQVEFGFSDKVAGRGMRAVQNLTTSALLANVFSAGLNLADIPGTVALMHGILPTIKATVQTITRRPTRITNADMGLANVIAEEFVSSTRNPITVNVPGYGSVALSAAKFLDSTMKYSGFKMLDAFGKEVAHNAAWIDAGRKVSSPKKLAEFTRENGAYFGEDLGQLVSDLRAGKRSELALEYLWKQISDAQPISSLEMPTARTANPNWRFAWQMRSWMIKQMTLMRQKGFDEIRKGDAASVARGTKFLLRYSLFVGSAGAGANFIIQSLLGRDRELEWGDIPLNALKNFGMSQYTMDKVAEGKLGEAAASVLSPPALVLFEIASGKPEAVRNIPLIGRFVYNRVMGGAEKANEKAEREERRKEREE